MYISNVSLVNYKNFRNAKFIFKKGVNTIIGENGAGKTNLFKAIRLLLDGDLPRFAQRLNESDFFRGLGDWKGHWIIISIQFDDISTEEAVQSLFIHGLAAAGQPIIQSATYNLIFRPKAEVRLKLSELNRGDITSMKLLLEKITIEDYEVLVTGKSTVDFNDSSIYKSLVGDFENTIFNSNLNDPRIGVVTPSQLSISKEISFSYIKALRDVVSDFQNNKKNPLVNLLKSKSENIDPAVYEPISVLIKQLNGSIESLDDVGTLRDDVLLTIKEAVGEAYSPTSLSIRSNLSEDAEKMLQSLKLFVGEGHGAHEGDIYDLSLGGANLIYLTLKLLEFKYKKNKNTVANFLFIEEPEAHIHTHVQKTLFDKIDSSETQIIYSTHSTHIADVCNITNMNVLSRSLSGCESFHPSNGLSTLEQQHLSRYLDAVRSNLLFAKSVLLVEGDAEEILIPSLIKKRMGVSLDEIGISLINIRSTGFENVAKLFHESRIKRNCGIITDLDTSIINTTVEGSDDDSMIKFKNKCAASQKSGLARQIVLNNFINGNKYIQVFFGIHTFEVDFLEAQNLLVFENSIKRVYSDPATQVAALGDLKSPDLAVRGKRVLTMANHMGKGWFAILLDENVGEYSRIPIHILSALKMVCPTLNNKTIWDLCNYRISSNEKYYGAPHPHYNTIKDEGKKFVQGKISRKDFLDLAIIVFKGEELSIFLQGAY